MRFFTVYWKSGERQFIEGRNFDQALFNHGIPRELIPQMQFYKDGFNNEFKFNRTKEAWEKLQYPPRVIDAYRISVGKTALNRQEAEKDYLRFRALGIRCARVGDKLLVPVPDIAKVWCNKFTSFKRAI